MIFTSEAAADSPIRQKQAQMIPLLSKQLNELDSTFKLPEGPYTFENERQARRIMEAALAEYTPSVTLDSAQSQAIAPSSTATSCVSSSAVLQKSDDTGGRLRDAIIDITPVETEKANGGGVDGSGVGIDNELLP
jgi:hypothetical protein